MKPTKSLFLTAIFLFLSNHFLFAQLPTISVTPNTNKVDFTIKNITQLKKLVKDPSYKIFHIYSDGGYAVDFTTSWPESDTFSHVFPGDWSFVDQDGYEIYSYLADRYGDKEPPEVELKADRDKITFASNSDEPTIKSIIPNDRFIAVDTFGPPTSRIKSIFAISYKPKIANKNKVEVHFLYGSSKRPNRTYYQPRNLGHASPLSHIPEYSKRSKLIKGNADALDTIAGNRSRFQGDYAKYLSYTVNKEELNIPLGNNQNGKPIERRLFHVFDSNLEEAFDKFKVGDSSQVLAIITDSLVNLPNKNDPRWAPLLPYFPDSVLRINNLPIKDFTIIKQVVSAAHDPLFLKVNEICQCSSNPDLYTVNYQLDVCNDGLKSLKMDALFTLHLQIDELDCFNNLKLFKKWNNGLGWKKFNKSEFANENDKTYQFLIKTAYRRSIPADSCYQLHFSFQTDSIGLSKIQAGITSVNVTSNLRANNSTGRVTGTFNAIDNGYYRGGTVAACSNNNQCPACFDYGPGFIGKIFSYKDFMNFANQESEQGSTLSLPFLLLGLIILIIIIVFFIRKSRSSNVE